MKNLYNNYSTNYTTCMSLNKLISNKNVIKTTSNVLIVHIATQVNDSRKIRLVPLYIVGIHRGQTCPETKGRGLISTLQLNELASHAGLGQVKMSAIIYRWK